MAVAAGALELGGLQAFEAVPERPGRLPAVVLLHGSFNHAGQYVEWLTQLASAGVRALAVSYSGGAARTVGAMAQVDLDVYLTRLRKALDALGGTPVLAGHSMGGLLAQRLAAAGRAAGLILIASAPPWPVLLPFATLVSALPILPTVLAGRPLAPPAVLVGIAFNHVPPNERAALLRTFAPESGRALRDMLFGKLRVQRGAVRCPVLSIGGADDRLISPRTQRKIAAFYGARHEALPDHGHWLVTEPGWQAVPQRMVEWLASGR